MKFKNQDTENDYQFIKERLKIVLEDMDAFHKLHGYEMIVTDLISTEGEDAALKRVSPSHRQGRAADLRTYHLDPIFIKELITHFSKKYEHWAAISKRDLKPRLVVYHEGSGLHFHVQIRPYND